MSVTVILARHDSHGPTASSDVYNDAENIQISETGVLTVGCGWQTDRIVIGAYPSGTWLNAFVDDEREWRSGENAKIPHQDRVSAGQ